MANILLLYTMPQNKQITKVILYAHVGKALVTGL